MACYTNGTSLRWVITFPYHYLPEVRIISSSGPADSQTPLLENSALFQFLRTSRTPLMSTMLIDNITTNLNGTKIDCWFNEGRSTTVIDVIRNGIIQELNKLQKSNRVIIDPWVISKLVISTTCS